VKRATPWSHLPVHPTHGNAKAQSGSLGVAGYVSQDYGEGAITYVEYFASSRPSCREGALPAAGYYIEPDRAAGGGGSPEGRHQHLTPSSPSTSTDSRRFYNNADPAPIRSRATRV
jgi:hypothetical protein